MKSTLYLKFIFIYTGGSSNEIKTIRRQSCIENS